MDAVLQAGRHPAPMEDEAVEATRPSLPGDEAIAEIYSEVGVAQSSAGWGGLLDRVLALHPSYLRCMVVTHDFVMSADGPLPRHWRHFLAAVASTRHTSTFFFDRAKRSFLASGGEPLWLQGPSNMPRKLANIFDLNAVLAHRPWLLSQDHIRDLLKGDDAWSSSELVHAVVVLCEFHSLASLAFGVGIFDEDQRTTQWEQAAAQGPRGGSAAEVAGSSGEGSPGRVRASSSSAELARNYEEKQIRRRLRQDLGEVLSLSNSDNVFEEADNESAASSEPPQAAAATGSVDAGKLFKATALVERRDVARAAGDYGVADALRQELRELGFEVEDSLNGSTLVPVVRAAPTTRSAGLPDQPPPPPSSSTAEPAPGTAAGGGEADAGGGEEEVGGALASSAEGTTAKPPAAAARAASFDSALATAGGGGSSQGERASEEEAAAAAATVAAAAEEERRKASMRCLGASVSFGHTDFDVKSKEYTVFRAQDYSWEDQCFSLLERFFRGVAPLLDRQFNLIYSLTYGTFSEEHDIDTQPLRQAVWFYVYRLFGIVNDDYEYKVVNFFLTREMQVSPPEFSNWRFDWKSLDFAAAPLTRVGRKQYIKKVACYPETIMPGEFDEFSAALKSEEKVHVVVLAIEARKQAQLLYGLRSIAAFKMNEYSSR